MWSPKTLWITPADLKTKARTKGCGLNYKQRKLLTSVLKSAREIHRDIPDGFGFCFEIGRLAGVADDTAGAAHPKEETNHPTEEQTNPTEVKNHRTEENNYPTDEDKLHCCLRKS